MAKFRIAVKPTFAAVVDISKAGDEQPGQITFTFKHKSKPELLAFFELIAGSPAIGDVPEKPPLTAAQCVMQFAAGWDVTDENDIPVDFNLATIQLVLDNYHNAYNEIYSKYLSELTKFKKGN